MNNENIIHSYSRAQALDDGDLVDVTETAKEAGFKYPVALTRTVWNTYVEVPAGVEGQDEAGRLWDILFMLRLAARGSDDAHQCPRDKKDVDHPQNAGEAHMHQARIVAA
jgi:hypothetical protein